MPGNKARLKTDKTITVDDLQEMLHKICQVAGTSDLVQLFKPVKVAGIVDDCSPTKAIVTLVEMSKIVNVVLDWASNTKLPKKHLESALIADNAVDGRRWHFSHMRLLDAATDLGTLIRTLMSKLRDLAVSTTAYRRAIAQAFCFMRF